jgi:hypothetical protein
MHYHHCTQLQAMITPMSISGECGTLPLGGGISVNKAFAARKAGHGNDRVWKAWKAMKPASHPSHTPWKSLRDSHAL